MKIIVIIILMALSFVFARALLSSFAAASCLRLRKLIASESERPTVTGERPEPWSSLSAGTNGRTNGSDDGANRKLVKNARARADSIGGPSMVARVALLCLGGGGFRIERADKILPIQMKNNNNSNKAKAKKFAASLTASRNILLLVPPPPLTKPTGHPTTFRARKKVLVGVRLHAAANSRLTARTGRRPAR